MGRVGRQGDLCKRFLLEGIERVDHNAENAICQKINDDLTAIMEKRLKKKTSKISKKENIDPNQQSINVFFKANT